MKKNELIEVKIESHEFPATGIGYQDGVKVFVKGAFPGQTVSARVSKNRNGKAEAKLRCVSEKAPYEIEAPCRHFGKCGGCISQNIPMDIQEKMKNDEVVRLFSETGLPMGEFEGLAAVKEQYGYWNKMEITFGDEVRNGELTLGMHYRCVKNAVVNVD
ncbi:MAG: TRAM domain-containing protein, partial [Youngiibacter sp.]|nr:TRAM domain-containing protein [Youngiibacter sp.]